MWDQPACAGDLIDLISQPTDARLIFRGMACATWDLMTSLERRWDAQQGCVNLDLVDRFEAVQVREFRNLLKDNDLDLLRRSSEVDPNVEALAMLQHYGAPTRLLDWTMSPAIGVWFAFDRDTKCTEPMALWVLDRSRSASTLPIETAEDIASCNLSTLQQVRGLDHPYPIPVIPQVLENQRIKNQQAVMSMSPDLTPYTASSLVAPVFQEGLSAHEQLLGIFNPSHSKIHRVVTIESAWQTEIYEWLRKQGITRDFIYPTRTDDFAVKTSLAESATCHAVAATGAPVSHR